MKFKIERVTSWRDKKCPVEGAVYESVPNPFDGKMPWTVPHFIEYWTITVASIDDLKALALKSGEDLIVSFDDPKPGLDGSITIYDDYVE